MAQRNFTEGNDIFRQEKLGESFINDQLFFLGGNDAAVFLRNDDLAGFGLNGGVDMGAGNDVIVTDFNQEGGFVLGDGNDIFTSEGSGGVSGIVPMQVAGGNGDDVMIVDTFGSRYFGEVGNDTFITSAADNFFDGGDGIDTYSAERAEKGATIDILQGQAFSFFSATAERFSNVENARGSNFADKIFGDDNANRIDGLAGDDDIDADGGDDTIDGGAGQNEVFGDLGFDTLVIDANRAVVQISGNATQFVITGTLADGSAFSTTAAAVEQIQFKDQLLSAGQLFFPAVTGLVDAAKIIGPLVSIADTSARITAAFNGADPVDPPGVTGKTVTGDGKNNSLTGGENNDTISGKGGNDKLKGLAGDDRLSGGKGNDSLKGGDGDDSLFGGKGDDSLKGGNGDDNLEGQSGADKLSGGAGSDVLDGGKGKDTLKGGDGQDFFVFNAEPVKANADKITDFSVADDSIGLSADIFGIAKTGLSADLFKVIGDGASADEDDRVIYNSDSGKLFFDADGSGGGKAKLIATLEAGLALTELDFFGI